MVQTAANVTVTATAINTSISGGKIPVVLVPRMQGEQRLLSERESQSPSLWWWSWSSPSSPSSSWLWSWSVTSSHCPLLDIFTGYAWTLYWICLDPLLDMPFLQSDFSMSYNMVLLDPTPLSINDPRPFELQNDDIDSLMMMTTSIEPFNCRKYAVFHTRPPRVFRCQNTKLTAYLENRLDFAGPPFSVSPPPRNDQK